MNVVDICHQSVMMKKYKQLLRFDRHALERVFIAILFISYDRQSSETSPHTLQEVRNENRLDRFGAVLKMKEVRRWLVALPKRLATTLNFAQFVIV